MYNIFSLVHMACRKESISDKTARIYARVLTRFAEFMYIYMVYMLLYFFLALLTIVDSTDAANVSWLVCGLLYVVQLSCSLPLVKSIYCIYAHIVLMIILGSGKSVKEFRYRVSAYGLWLIGLALFLYKSFWFMGLFFSLILRIPLNVSFSL